MTSALKSPLAVSHFSSLFFEELKITLSGLIYTVRGKLDCLIYEMLFIRKKKLG